MLVDLVSLMLTPIPSLSKARATLLKRKSDHVTPAQSLALASQMPEYTQTPAFLFSAGFPSSLGYPMNLNF